MESTLTEMDKTEGSRFVGEGVQFGIKGVEDVYWAYLINCAIATSVCCISPLH